MPLRLDRHFLSIQHLGAVLKRHRAVITITLPASVCVRGQKGGGRRWPGSNQNGGANLLGKLLFCLLSVNTLPAAKLIDRGACRGTAGLFVCAQAHKQPGSNHSRCLLTQRKVRQARSKSIILQCATFALLVRMFCGNYLI